MSNSFQALFKHTSIYAVGNALQRGAGFVLLPLYISTLTPGEYGALDLIYSISAVFSGLLGAGLAHATLRFFFEYDTTHMSNRVVSTGLISTTVLTGVAVLILLQFSGGMAEIFFEGHYQLGISIALITILFELIRQIGLAYFRAKEYSVKYVTVAFIQFVVQFAINIYTVAILKLGVDGVLIGNFFAVLLGTCYVMFITIRECGIGFDRGIFNSIVKYAYPFVLNSLLGTITGNADRFLIRYFLSLEALGIYALAMKFAQLLKFLLIDSFQLGFGSYRFSIMKDANAKELLVKLGTYYVAIITLSAVGICLLAGDAIRLVSEVEYWEAIALVPLLIFATTIGSTNYILTTGILYQKSTRKLVRINLVKSIWILVLDLLLIPFIGVYGAALALVGSATAGVVITDLVSQKLYPVEWDYKKSISIMAWGFGIVFVSNFFVPESIVISLSVRLALVMTFVTGVFVFKMLYGDEVGQVRKFLSRKTA